jgi:NAD(P)-dependent dehydrogenase (short-subunit alcohol dehydrogenase family)
MKEVEGKVAVITGGASGIGLGIAHAFARAGMKVVITYRSEAHVASARALLAFARESVLAIKLEVTDRRAMERAAEDIVRQLGGVHVLCNNAAVGITVPVADASFDDWDWAIGVNIGGVVNGIRAFLPRMRASGEPGHIVSTASMGGLFIGGNVGVYNTTKYAIVGMMEALRADLAETPIGVSVLCPGLVNTDIHLAESTRPARYSQSGSQLSGTERISRAAWFKENVLAAGMDPLEIGELTLRGIRNNDLHILTHPEYADGARERFEAILAAMPRDASIPEGRARAEARVIRHPMYAAERDRRRRETNANE